MAMSFSGFYQGASNIEGRFEGCVNSDLVPLVGGINALGNVGTTCTIGPLIDDVFTVSVAIAFPPMSGTDLPNMLAAVAALA